MKKLFLFLFLSTLIPFIANAIKIEKNEIDEFTGKRTVITSWEGICGNEIHVRFRMQNGLNLLDYKMFYDGSIVIGEGDKLMFKSATDNIGELKSITTYIGTKGGGATGFIGSSAWGIKATYTGDLSYFNDNITRLIRVYTTDWYSDKQINESDGKKLQKLYALFLTAQDMEPGKAANYANYLITFLKSTDNGKSWDKVDEKYIKDASFEELETIMNDWKSQSSGRKKFDCKIKKEK